MNHAPDRKSGTTIEVGIVGRVTPPGGSPSRFYQGGARCPQRARCPRTAHGRLGDKPPHPKIFVARRLIVVALLAGSAAAAASETPADLATERAKVQSDFPAEFAHVVDDPALPRVLLIGDSISIGYTTPVRELLKGVANIHRVPESGGPTPRGLQQLAWWLGDGKWDVIHFNFGLHDIKLNDEGKPLTSPAEYEANLRELVARLRKTGAKIVFATTTPVPADLNSGPKRRVEDVIERNKIAVRVMTELGVPVNDLYAVALPRLKEIQRPKNVHYTEEGYQVLAKPVAATIRAQLGLRAD